MQAVAVLPHDLAAMPPGPGLAAVLGAVALSAVPNDRMLDVLAAQPAVPRAGPDGGHPRRAGPLLR